MTYSKAPPLISYIPYIVPVVEAFFPSGVLYAPFATVLALPAGAPYPVIELSLLFIPISVQLVLLVHLPYILCVRYAAVLLLFH